MSVDELDSLIRWVAKQPWSNAQKIVFYSELFLDMPYEFYCMGDGPYAHYDTAPLMNFEKINCMTYCEEVLALSLSRTYEEMFNILQHIRYYGGVIGMNTRKHYTMVDWLPGNKWCLRDVSKSIGGKYARKLTRTIKHGKFFREKGLTDVYPILPDRKFTIYYIPKEHLLDVVDKIHSGDIIALIQDKPGIFSAHMGLIIKKEAKVVLRHAPMNRGKVLDDRFDEYVKGLQEYDKLLGMSFMRVREKIKWIGNRTTHGRMMLKLLTK